MEHLQSEEPFSSDPYFSLEKFTSKDMKSKIQHLGHAKEQTLVMIGLSNSIIILYIFHSNLTQGGFFVKITEFLCNISALCKNQGIELSV